MLMSNRRSGDSLTKPVFFEIMIPMNIGIDVRELTGNITGIGRMLFNFLECISLLDTGDTFVLFGNKQTYLDYDFLKNKKFKKIIIPQALALWWDQFQLKNALMQAGCNVFFSPYYKMPLFLKIPSVISMFDITYLILKPYSRKFAYNFYLRNYISIAAKKAKRVLTSCENSKRDIIRELGIPSEMTVTVPLSVGKKFKPADSADIQNIRSKYNLQGKFLLYLGNFSPHKNLSRLMDAYKCLPDTIKKEYSLVFAGGSGQKNTDDKISFLGCIPEQNLPALYSSAELFVFPSLYEGFGIPPLEAMACGCPVISSRTSSMPEILGDACIYFDPYNTQDITDKLQQVLTDAVLRQTMRQKGFERARQYTSERMTQKILGLLQN